MSTSAVLRVFFFISYYLAIDQNFEFDAHLKCGFFFVVGKIQVPGFRLFVRN